MPLGKLDHITGTPSTPKWVEMVMMGQVTASNASTLPDRNILHWYTPVPLPGGDLTTFWNNFWALIGTAWADAKSDSYNLVSAVLQYIDDPTSIKETVLVGVTGTVATDRSAQFNAGVIRKTSGLTGKNWRGSMHIGALPETFTTKDQLNASPGSVKYQAIVDVLQGLVTTGLSDGGSTFYPVILSPTQSDRISIPAVLTASYVRDFLLNLKVGTMKRRKERGVAA